MNSQSNLGLLVCFWFIFFFFFLNWIYWGDIGLQNHTGFKCITQWNTICTLHHVPIAPSTVSFHPHLPSVPTSACCLPLPLWDHHTVVWVCSAMNFILCPYFKILLHKIKSIAELTFFPALKMNQIQRYNFVSPESLLCWKNRGCCDILLSWEWLTTLLHGSCSSRVAELVFLQEGLGRNQFSHREHKALAPVIPTTENRARGNSSLNLFTVWLVIPHIEMGKMNLRDQSSRK